MDYDNYTTNELVALSNALAQVDELAADPAMPADFDHITRSNLRSGLLTRERACCGTYRTHVCMSLTMVCRERA